MGGTLGRQSSAGRPSQIFGGAGGGAARGVFRHFLRPLQRGLGIGNTRGARRFQRRLDAGEFGGPLAGIIQQIQGFAPGVFGQAQSIGSDIAARAPEAFADIQSQIQSALASLPALQAQGQGLLASGQGLIGGGETLLGQGQGLIGRAEDLVDQAFSPIQGRALFQEASRQALGSAQQGLAARGLLDQGTGVQTERDITRDLAQQFALRGQETQQGALSGLGQAIGGQAGLLGTQSGLLGAQSGLLDQQLGLDTAGIGIAQQLFPALQDLANLQQQGFQIPLQALGSILALLTGTTDQGIALAQAGRPGQRTSSSGFNLGMGKGCLHSSTPIETPDGSIRVDELRIGDEVTSTNKLGDLVVGKVAAAAKRPVEAGHLLIAVKQPTGTFFISPDHPLPDGKPVESIFPEAGKLPVWRDRIFTHDIVVDSPTGVYFVHGVALGSTLDDRHRESTAEVQWQQS